MTLIKAVCFDLDGVYFTPRGKQSFQEALVSEFGADRAAAVEFMATSSEMAQLVRGQIAPGPFWNALRSATGITAGDRELAERWVRDYEVAPEVKRAVSRAKELGFKTCVCTNNNGIRLPILMERFDLNRDFDVIISSHEVGACKPEKEIFRALIEKAGVDASELVYSDDNPERLSGARELGIKTFAYRDFGQFLQELARLGVDLGYPEEKLPRI